MTEVTAPSVSLRVRLHRAGWTIITSPSHPRQRKRAQSWEVNNFRPARHSWNAPEQNGDAHTRSENKSISAVVTCVSLTRWRTEHGCCVLGSFGLHRCRQDGPFYSKINNELFGFCPCWAVGVFHSRRLLISSWYELLLFLILPDDGGVVCKLDNRVLSLSFCHHFSPWATLTCEVMNTTCSTEISCSPGLSLP